MRVVLIILFTQLFCFSLIAQDKLSYQLASDSLTKGYPQPPLTKHLLFYIQRTHNTNTIIYEINYNTDDSTINSAEPIKVYWIRYAEKGERAPLTYVQNQFAYGVKTKLINKEKQIYKVGLVAYPKAEIYLIYSKVDNQFRTYIHHDKKFINLKRIFFKTNGGTFLNPNIEFVQISGIETKSGQFIQTKFKP